jgi:hypothetical protein
MYFVAGFHRYNGVTARVSVLCQQCAFDCAGDHWEYQGGTLIYTAPELIRALRSQPDRDALLRLDSLYGPPADVWALGLTAYKWLTGGCLFTLGKDVTPSDTAWARGDHGTRRSQRRLADLHADWVSGGSASFNVFHDFLHWWHAWDRTALSIIMMVVEMHTWSSDWKHAIVIIVDMAHVMSGSVILRELLGQAVHPRVQVRRSVMTLGREKGHANMSERMVAYLV